MLTMAAVCILVILKVYTVDNRLSLSFPEYPIIRNEFLEIIRLLGEYYIFHVLLLSGKFIIRMIFKKKSILIPDNRLSTVYQYKFY